jgi:hypothetical protein
MAAPERMKWLDLTAHGVKLRLFQMTDKTVNLVLSGIVPGSAEWMAVQSLGFEPARSGRTLVRAGTDVQTGALRKLFPKNRIRDMELSEVWMRVTGQATGVAKRPEDRTVLGRNHLDNVVRADTDGTRYITFPEGQVSRERDLEPGAMSGDDFASATLAASFLRVTSKQALALCADTFVNEMLAGRNMDSGDLRYFGGVIYDEPRSLDISDTRLRAVQEAVEAAMQRALSSRYRMADEAAYRLAVNLVERQPTFSFRTSTSVENQQYSTPLPMSIAVQHILGDTSRGKVLEPTIGNGSLVTALPIGTSITGVEIDPARSAQVGVLRGDIKVITGDVLGLAGTLPSDFDFIAANPPFGGLGSPVQFEDLRCNRIDHLIALRALKQRKDDGRAVFIIAADRENLIEQGKVAGGSKSFFAWLADHYVVEDAVELDGALYRKQGAEYPVRMVTVGRRRTVAEAQEALATKQYRLGERLPVIHTWDGLWEHTVALGHKLKTGHAATADAIPQPPSSDAPAAQADAVPASPKQFVIPAPPTLDYRITTRRNSTYIVPLVGKGFTKEGREGLVNWLKGAGFFASATDDHSIIVSQITDGPALALIVDGLEEQKHGRLVAKAKDADPNLGRKWKSRDGEVQIVGYWGNGTDKYITTLDGKVGGAPIVPRADLENHLTLDERTAADHEARLKRIVEEDAKAAEQKAIAEDIDGFGDDMNPMTRGRTVSVLNSQRRFRGEAKSIKDVVRTLVSEGRTIEPIGGERALVDADGNYIGERALLATGMEYAAYLIAKRESAPRADAEPDLSDDVENELFGNPEAADVTNLGEAIAPAAGTANGPAAVVAAAANATAPVVAAEPLAANVEAPQDVQPVEYNDYQAPYLPSSKLNEPSAMIPRNLEEPVRRALARLVEEIGMDVDQYVADKLQLTVEDMELAFSAEQVDAIALAIKRSEEGRGFINGDQTGQGKGRVLAALARYAALNSKPVVFFTEKANLFSDFWRDLKDIDSHKLFRPLILNDGEPIRNMDTNQIEIPATKKSVITGLIDKDMSIAGAGYNLMFSTYSQFNRERSASKKSAWLPAAATGAMLLVDESHVAAGESNTADNMGLAVEMADSCVYSSATFAKNARNMRAYAKVFPESVSVESLADTLVAGGEPLQEILSAMLAEEGVFVRREHDLSQLEFETVSTADTRERDEAWADSLSAALRAMSFLSGDATRVMKRMDKEIKKKLDNMPEEARKGNRMGVSYQGFGSRLYNILRQFSLSLKIDKVADQAVVALQNGRKPVIVLEQTFEALLKEALTDSVRNDDEELSIAEQVAENAATSMNGRTVDVLTFRDVMRRVAKKLEYIYVRDDYGNGHYEHVQAQAKNQEEAEAIEEAIKDIAEKIAELPDIPVSPLDTLRYKLSQAGFSNGEISGRSFQTEPVPDDPNKILVTIRPDQRIQTLADFNNGRVDAVTLTRAGSTGLSAHSSAKFADRRQREMIEAQIANNVAERVQFFGRVNRRGQVNSPRITTVVTPLPSEKRVLAMQNAKLRKLSANTQSNRNNQAEMRDVPDILNPVGDEICRRYLEENPDIAALLGIDPEESVASDDDAYFANKLTGRIALLPVAKQKEAYAELSRVFNETIKEMEGKGVNPFQTSVWDWKARIIDKKVFRAGKRTGSVFDEPVYLARAEWDEEVVPYSSEHVLQGIERGRNMLTTNDPRFSLVERQYSVGRHDKVQVKAEGMLKDIADAFRQVQNRALKSLPQFKDVEEAKATSETNPIKASAMRHDWMQRHLPSLMPGSIIGFTGREDVSEKGVILSLFTPDKEKRHEAHLLGQYSVRVIVPGTDKTQEFTLNQLLNDPLFSHEHFLGNDYRDPLKAFDVAKPGIVTFSRNVLMGNMFSASQFVAEHRLGSAAIFTDDSGARHRAVVLYSRVTQDDVMKMPVALNRSSISKVLEQAYLQGYSVRLVASATLSDKECAVIFDRNRPASLTITTVGSKAAGGVVYGNKDLTAITGDFAGSRATMSATVDFSRMEAVMNCLVSRCNQSFYIDVESANRLLPELGGGAAEDDANDDQDDDSDDAAGQQRPRFAA